MGTTKTELQRVLQLSDDVSWTEWLQSRFVKPWWLELWENHIAKRTTSERGRGISEIQAKIMMGETNGNTKYSMHDPDKTDWDSADHLARFHYNVKLENSRSNEGVFFGRHFSDQYMDKIVWSLKGYLTKIHSPSYINKRNGGAAIFGTLQSGE